MSNSNLKANLEPTFAAFQFIRKNWIILLSLGLVAGFGRVVQLGGFGEVSRVTHTMLEVVVEGSRVAILLFVIGVANFRKGADQVMRIFRGRVPVKQYAKLAWCRMKNRWIALTASFMVFGVMAWCMNLLIDQLAYETCLYLSLREQGILVDNSSEWTILLFFKNLSVIPFTLVFETVMLLWLIDRTDPGAVKVA